MSARVLMPMRPVEPIHTVELFPALSAELLHVLRALPPAGWQAATACPGWSVKDIVAHLLGGNLGRLSSGRDGPADPKAKAVPTDYAGLVTHINNENADWVKAARRISPDLLIQFLEITDQRVYESFKALPPLEPGGIAVAWAGDTRSPHWFDIAREYTEKWLHQQHIREAVGQPVLAERRWFSPVLDTFMRALPYTYRGVEAADGAAVRFHIAGEAGGDWSLLRRNGRWLLFSGAAPGAVCSVRVDQDIAWRLFTRGIGHEAAWAAVQVDGDAALGMSILHMVSIMA
jgi:uncharacterized protein (TIGR03083 family)